MAATDIDKLLIYHRSDDGGLLPLDSPTTQIGANATTILGSPVSLGFDFHFDGVLTQSTIIGACGAIGSTGWTSDNANLFAAANTVIVAPWYDAMKTAESTGYVKTELQGTAPFRRFIIEWKVYSVSSDTASDNDLLQFQCVLYETFDRIEFRYAARVRTGSPDTGSASVGFKADTSSTSTNYRDLWTDNRTLGASNTTTETGLDFSDYDALVTLGTIVIEPNWPMCGRYVPIRPQQLAGLQHPYGEPIWALANNVNWLYCHHAPPLVCWAPHTNGAYSLTMYYAIPVTPSADGLTYRVYLITYSSAGGNLEAWVDRDNSLSDPQPSTDGDWVNLSAPTATGTSAGYHDWTSFTVTIPATAQFLRVKLTPASGSMYLAHVLVVPEQLTDIDETATPASGVLPMALGQIRQRGAAVHPELYNRAWKNIARILNDRRQMLWSYGRSDHADAGIANGAGRGTAIVGVAPASLRGWRGYTASAVIYAYGDTDGGSAQFVERGGGGHTFTVNANGGEYYRQTQDLELVSEEPLILLSSTVINEMWIGFCGLTWVPGWDEDTDLFQGVTPAPSLEKLIALASRLHRACIGVYAMTGLATPLERVVGTGNPVMLRWQVPIATKALRPKVIRVNNDLSDPAVATELTSVSSGGTASDIIVIPNPHAQGSETYPWDGGGGDIQVASGAEVYDASPPAEGDRLLESPTATLLTGPTPERVTVQLGAGMGLVPYPADPYTL